MDPTSQPEGEQPAAPEAPAVPDYGAPPEVIQEALSVYRDLNNLDTRHQRLSQIMRPDIDGQFLRSFGEPQEPQDPYAQYDPQQQYAQYDDPQAYEPQPMPFDPREYAETIEQSVTRKIFDQLGEMAQSQAIKDAAQSAVSKAGLPDDLAEMVEFRVKGQAQLQPNRQPSDLANEVAQQLAMKFSQWAAAPSGNPAPSAPPPSGPAPSLQERPTSFEDLARIAAENLRG